MCSYKKTNRCACCCDTSILNTKPETGGTKPNIFRTSTMTCMICTWYNKRLPFGMWLTSNPGRV